MYNNLSSILNNKVGRWCRIFCWRMERSHVNFTNLTKITLVISVANISKMVCKFVRPSVQGKNKDNINYSAYKTLYSCFINKLINGCTQVPYKMFPYNLINFLIPGPNIPLFFFVKKSLTFFFTHWEFYLTLNCIIQNLHFQYDFSKV